jgi:hypothetical protein
MNFGMIAHGEHGSYYLDIFEGKVTIKVQRKEDPLSMNDIANLVAHRSGMNHYAMEFRSQEEFGEYEDVVAGFSAALRAFNIYTEEA